MSLSDDIKRLGMSGLAIVGDTLSAMATSSLAKADTEGPEATPGGTQQDSAKSNPVPTEKATEDPKSLFWDPFAIIEQMGYKDRPSAITFGTLKAIVWKTPVIQAIVQTRVNQVAAFARPQHDRYQLGFRIKLREQEKEPTKIERKWMQQMESLMMRTGVTDNPRGRDNFEVFLRKLTWDSLTLDQCTYEIVPNRKGEPAEWYAVDASTIRLADSASTYLDEDLKDVTRYVQIYDGMVIAEFNQEELCFGVRNPRTDIRLFGYGTSEIEMLITTVTSLLYAFEYNQLFFKQGSAAKGIINFKGTVPEKQLQAFRRQWYQMISGVENSWKTPVTNSDDLQYINLQSSSRDMEFNAWMDFLIKLTCFPPETRVAMGDGSLCEIAKVGPGDFVKTHMGRTQRVTNVQVSDFKGELTCLRVGGEVIKATPEHPFYAVSSKVNSWMSKEFEDPEWVKAEELIAGIDYLIVPKPRKLSKFVSKLDLRKYLEDYQQLDNQKIKPRTNRSNAIPAIIPLTIENAFVLGLFAAEGSVSRSNVSWSFHVDEKEYVKQVCRFLKKLGLKSTIVDMSERNGVQVRGTSVLLGRALRSAFGNYSKTRKIPYEILNAKDSVRQAFVSGVLAGDGSVWDTPRAVIASIATISRTFIDQLKWLLLGLDVWAGVYVTPRTASGFANASPLYTLRIQGSYLSVLSKWLSGEKAGKLSALLDTHLQAIKGHTLRSHVYRTDSYYFVPIVEVWSEPYQGSVFNLEVEKDHTYQVERCSVHNCSVYAMDPVEVNFKYGNVGQKGGLGEASNKEKITESKERGLRPILRFLANNFNQNLVWPINENFEFDFVGLDAKTQDAIADLNQKRVKTIYTIDELRAEDDLPPLPDGKGEIILDPTFLQWSQMKEGGMGAPEGEMGEGEAEESEESEGGESEKDTDFEKLLAQYESDETDEEDEAVNKSLDTQKWTVHL